MRAFAVDATRACEISLPETDQGTPPSFDDLTSFAEWLRGDLRIPAVVLWELTSICNFRCRFCYVVGHTEQRRVALPTAQGLIEQFIPAGVIQVVLTGGEPLTHPNFNNIYTLLKLAGIIVTLFTNASRLTDAHFDLFQRLPPYSIEISLYGDNEDSYERATGRRAYRRVLANIERLLAMGIAVTCKTPLTTLTDGAADSLTAWCAARRIPYFTTATIEDGLDGQSLSEFALTGIARTNAEIRKLKQRLPAARSPRDSRIAYNCGVGKTSVYVSWDESLSPCASLRQRKYPLSGTTFLDAWQEIVADVRLREGEVIHECHSRSCAAREICRMCPAWARDDGTRLVADAEYCRTTRARYDALRRAT